MTESPAGRSDQEIERLITHIDKDEYNQSVPKGAPWRAVPSCSGPDRWIVYQPTGSDQSRIIAEGIRQPFADFIAAARDLVPLLLARAQKAEGDYADLYSRIGDLQASEAELVAAPLRAERDRLRAELAAARRDKDYLYGRTLELGDERDRLSAQVAAVRALLDEYTEQSLYGESCVTHDRLRAALDGTGHDEPSEGEQP